MSYKILLEESDIPKQWYNLAADLPTPMQPPLGPDGNPVGPEQLAPVQSEGFFSAPEIASKNPATQQILLLDGNHRRTVAETIGLKYIPVVFIGWEEFEVDVWNRALPLENSDGLDELLARFGLSESQPAPTESGFRHALLHYQGKTHSFPANES